MNKFDVVIIGAGPGGLHAAKYLLDNSDKKILLIEKNKEIGPKICGGGLPGLTYQFNIKSNKTFTFKEQIIYINGKKKLIDLENPIMTISRKDLGEYQLGLIKGKKNLLVKTQTRVDQIKKNSIILSNKEEIYFDYLIGADGANSILRKYLNLKTEIYTGLHYLLPKKSFKDQIWYLNPKELGMGYIWIFPHQEYVSVGVYFNKNKLGIKKARELLNNFLTDKGFDYSKYKFEGAPISVLYKGIEFGNKFLVGDAAGLTSAATGEGISYAMISAEEVSKKILDSDYSFEGLKEILKYKRKQEFALKLGYRFPKLQSLFFHVGIKLLKSKKFQTSVGF